MIHQRLSTWLAGRRTRQDLRRRFANPEGQKRVLVSWWINPQYIPSCRLSDRQITIGPKVRPDQELAPFDGWTPFGSYDLFAELKRLRLPTEYDAIIVFADASGSNRPMNLAAFDCPKVLYMGDSHHLKSPLQGMLHYARAGRFDFILARNNRQHLHWFVEAGFNNVAWLPGIVPNLTRQFSSRRKQEVCFFGRDGGLHPRRTRLLTEFASRKPFSFVQLQGPHEAGADRFASTAVSLNCSLNGDLNLRVFEILAAGGCLLTDRLSDESGLGLLLQENKEYLAYDSIEECTDQARFLLGHPDAALGIARSGYDAFHARMRPEHRAQQLFEWVFQGRLDSMFRFTEIRGPRVERDATLYDRVSLYERLQELHRTEESPSVLFTSDVPRIHILDALDLRHLRISVLDTGDRSLASFAEISKRCQPISVEEAKSAAWQCIVGRDGTLPEGFQSGTN